MTKIYYAIYDTDTKTFKGRGSGGAKYTTEPTQTYEHRGRAEAAMKTHLRQRNRYFRKLDLVIKEITVSWNE